MSTYSQELFEQLLLLCDFRMCYCGFNSLPDELVEQILLACGFHAWCNARFVCHLWEKICAKHDQKINEFVRYRFKDKNFLDNLLGYKTSNYYIPYLPNSIEHGISYEYFPDSEIIRKMNSWVYGKRIFEISYSYHTSTFNGLCYEIDDPNYCVGKTIFTIIYVCEHYIVMIDDCKRHQKFTFVDI